jgi:hypothetical protein
MSTHDTMRPLFSAIGLTRDEANTIRFEVNEMIMTMQINADALKAIAEYPTWTPSMKVWAAYHLRRDTWRAWLLHPLRLWTVKLGF